MKGTGNTRNNINKTFLVITSIANHDNPVLFQLATESFNHKIPLIVIGDERSPEKFKLKGCDYYSIDRQKKLDFRLAKVLPINHYSRKNLGYLIALSKGAGIIIETDDDNLPLDRFWDKRTKQVKAHVLENNGWVNVYRYFTDNHIWPRGFPLENIQDDIPKLGNLVYSDCPVQQGLTDDIPDVDAIYRFTMPLPIRFNKAENIAMGFNNICPFNSQNTTWFKEAFPLLYLPSYCSFRITDIWRSIIAQRIAWTCGWSVLFQKSTMSHNRNQHNLMKDFQDEVPGYCNNGLIYKQLKEMKLRDGSEHIPDNMIRCYDKMISLNLIDKQEIDLLEAWLMDIESI